MAVLVAVLTVACAGGGPEPRPEAPAARQVVDLSHPFDAETLYWPTEDGFQLEQVASGRTEAGYFYAANRFRTAEHGGTHIDAPIHFFEGGQSVDEIPLARLIAPGVVVDVSDACALDPDYRVQVGDLEAWERVHGHLPDGAILLLRTGWGERWPDRAAYLGTKETGPEAVAGLHFPGLHPDAARWLVAERRIGAVGIDTASIDHGPSTLFESHVALFSADVPALENVANLGALPATGFTVAALPMKIGGGSGGPLRIAAWW
jgi:kynurenine formamidase